MRSFQDYTIFNSINPDTLTPKVKKSLPFPLENFDADVADAYFKVNELLIKLNAAQKNPVNQTDGKKKRLHSLKYKTKTILKMLKDLSFSSQNLSY